MGPEVLAGFAALIVIVALAGLGATRRRWLAAMKPRAIKPWWAWAILTVPALSGLAAFVLILILSPMIHE